MSEQYTSTKIGSVSNVPSTIGSQKSTASIRSHVKSGFSVSGKLAIDVGEAFIVAVQRMCVAMQELIRAFRRCLAHMVRRQTKLQAANLVTPYMPLTVSTLAYSKWVPENELRTGLRGMHTCNPSQHMRTSWLQERIGVLGRVSHEYIIAKPYTYPRSPHSYRTAWEAAFVGAMKMPTHPIVLPPGYQVKFVYNSTVS
jgi:hypothetical protein